MSNIAKIKTRRNMKVAAIDKILAELNKKFWFGNMIIDKVERSSGGYSGPLCGWVIKYKSPTKPDKKSWAGDDCIYMTRHFWLDADRQFTISHGGSGGDLGWWVDFMITNEILLKFNGICVDEGDGIPYRGIPNQYDSLAQFMGRFVAHVKEEDKVRFIIQSQLDIFTPPEFNLTVDKIIKEYRTLKG
jgi:hypothetical protein